MSRLTILVVASLVALTAVPPGTVEVASAGGASGNDISWPQCGRSYPAGPAFGIVGVGGGRPFSDNPCLGAEFQWAQASGAAGLYMNTANPGSDSAVINWYGQRTPDPGCSPANERACAYDFGYAAAQHAYRYATALAPAGPGHTWWLDVETGNSWTSDLGANLADIVGSIDYLTGRGVAVGIYSTRYQWGRITGGAALPSVPNWAAGAAGAAQAARFCAASRSFTGGPVVVAQYVAAGFDYDYPCPGSNALLHPSQAAAPSSLGSLLSSLLAALGLVPRVAGR